MFKPDNAHVLAQGRVHKILINPYAWMADGRGNFKFNQYDLNGKRLFSSHTMRLVVYGAPTSSVWIGTTTSNRPELWRIDGLLRWFGVRVRW